ncbi:MAG TPA: inositol monophosphatase [Burkholderiales bacterium]|nr:inositol monophosphatase [Burkholderiales bacterium]
MLPDLKTLRNLVRQIAQEELLPRFADVQRHTKLDGSVVTEADIALQQRLQQELARRWPEYDFLGEEMTGHEHEELMRVCTQKGLWCLDPLDGTSNFAAGVPYFAVSLALLIHCRPELGLVYDPVRDECFMAQRGKGARLNGLSLGTHAALELPLQRCIAAVDFKRLAAPLATRLGASPPYGSQRNFGASSLDWCWLADGRFHVYLHGGQKLWDYAAGHLILAEAGGRSQTLTGADVFAFGLDSRSVVAARDSRLFAAWQAWVSEHGNAIAAS